MYWRIGASADEVAGPSPDAACGILPADRDLDGNGGFQPQDDRQHRAPAQARAADCAASASLLAEVVSASGAWITVMVADADPERVAATLARWRRERAVERLPESLTVIADRLCIPASRRPRMVLRTMRTRWASLSESGTLTVSPDIIRARWAGVDYKFCYLYHPHHGPAFGRL
jgi:hypothetical protein